MHKRVCLFSPLAAYVKHKGIEPPSWVPQVLHSLTALDAPQDPSSSTGGFRCDNCHVNAYLSKPGIGEDNDIALRHAAEICERRAGVNARSFRDTAGCSIFVSMDAILFSLGARPVTVAEALTAAAVGVAVLLVLAVNCIGAYWVVQVDGVSVFDGFYWALITSTSVGLGDIETSEATRTFNTVYMLAAVGSVAYGLGKLVEVLCNIGKVRRIERFCARGVTTDLIAEIDVGGDGAVSRLEFASYMLVATGKLNQGDLNEVMALFDQYDLDGSGSIDQEDVALVNARNTPVDKGRTD